MANSGWTNNLKTPHKVWQLMIGQNVQKKSQRVVNSDWKNHSKKLIKSGENSDIDWPKSIQNKRVGGF